MDVSAIAANTSHQTANGVEKAMGQLSRSVNPVDAVHLSLAAATLSHQQIGWSLEIKSIKIADQIASLAIDIIG